jgi:hypothetical protein
MKAVAMNQTNEIMIEIEELEVKLAPSSSAGFLD